MTTLSKSIPEFVGRHYCPHTGVDKVMKAAMMEDLDHMVWSAMQEAISMYVELIEKHGCKPEVARSKALLEIHEGLSVDLAKEAQ